MKFSALIGPSYQAQAYSADVEQTINFYTERIESAGAKAQRVLLGSPGLAAFASSGFSPIRAHFELNGRAFAVIGFEFVELSSAGVVTNRGVVNNDGLPATMAGGGDATNQLQIIAGGTLYNFALDTNTLTTPASGGTTNVQGAYLDGYFLKLNTTSTFAISNLLDNTTYDPLQIAQRNDAPDRWSAIAVVGKFVILLGNETTSALYDAGSFPFPFALVPGVLVNHGIGANFSVCDLNGSAVWLSQSKGGARQIVRMTPQQWAVERLSTFAVEYAMSQYATVADAVGMTFQYQGHWFYHVNFPTANDSWTYDATSGEWMKWLYWNQDTAAYEAWRGQYHCFAFGLHLVGDRATGTIYQLSTTTYTDAGGTPLRRLRRCPFPRLLDTSDFVNCSQVQVLADVGVGLTTGQGSDPQMMARFSRDAGKTWGNERWTTMGAIGKYLTRITWNRNGRWRDGRGVLELVVSDPVPVRIVDAEFEAVRGAA